MISEDRKEQNEHLKEFCWSVVRDSELYRGSNELKNADCERVADRLFAKLRAQADEWINDQETKAVLNQEAA